MKQLQKLLYYNNWEKNMSSLYWTLNKSFNTHTARSVSYTHLDVYKRQALLCQNIFLSSTTFLIVFLIFFVLAYRIFSRFFYNTIQFFMKNCFQKGAWTALRCVPSQKCTDYILLICDRYRIYDSCILLFSTSLQTACTAWV